MRRILIIKSSSMGDVVHALPVAYDIKQALPDSRIDWVVEEAFADIVELSPWIRQDRDGVPPLAQTSAVG